MSVCPCCGSALGPDKKIRVSLETNTISVGWSPLQITVAPALAELADILVSCMPRVATTEHIDSGLWGGNPPGALRKARHVYASQLRKAIAPLGLEIENVWDTGYRLVYSKTIRKAA